MNLILLFDQDKISDNQYRLDDFRAVHIINILKLKIDDRLKVGFVNGSKFSAVITEADKKTITLKLADKIEQEAIASNIDLIVALPRPQILKKVLFICGMMNVKRLHLIRSQRVEKSFYQSPLLQDEKINQNLYEGMMQGENLRLCDVVIHDRFKNFFEDYVSANYDASYLKLCADNHAQNSLDIYVKFPQDNFLIAIGPEGGWVDFELELIQSRGFKLIALGAYNLRVEFAVNAVLSQLSLLSLR